MNSNMSAFEHLYEFGTLPNRCIPKYQERPEMDLTVIDEKRIYQWVASNPHIKEVMSIPKYEDNLFTEPDYFGTSYAGSRYYIPPTGPALRMDLGYYFLNHVNIETELIDLGFLPNISYRIWHNEHTSPVLEELGWIRIMKENAVILTPMPPTKSQYDFIEEWIENWGEVQKFYLVVFPDTSVVKIEPDTFENFKTSKYVLGSIRKFYSTWELPPNQKKLLEFRKNTPNNQDNLEMHMKEEKDLRNQIKAKITEYYQKFKQPNKYVMGDPVPYASRVYDEKEMCALTDTVLDFWLTSGEQVDKFEKAIKDYLGVSYALSVNSGSSANLLAFFALTDPSLGDRAIKRGDEIITVACGFPTTISPILQYGAVPVFLDVTIPEYNINVELLEKAVSSKTKAVMLAHTLGNPFNIKDVSDFCKAHNLWLIEDNCDALGSKYTIDGVTKFTGTFGDIGTSSFYPAHHITTGEGGAVYTNNYSLYKIMKSMRDWGRDCVCPSGTDNLCGHRFDGQFGLLPEGYDHKYVYGHIGFNLKMTEMQAAIGYEQIQKADAFAQARQENFDAFYNCLESSLGKHLILPKPTKNSMPCWFGLPITVKSEQFQRKDFTNYLERLGIQTRPLFGGNLIRHPWFDSIRGTDAYRVVGDLTNSDVITENTFWIGVSPSITQEKRDYMCRAISTFAWHKREYFPLGY